MRRVGTICLFNILSILTGCSTQTVHWMMIEPIETPLGQINFQMYGSHAFVNDVERDKETYYVIARFTENAAWPEDAGIRIQFHSAVDEVLTADTGWFGLVAGRAEAWGPVVVGRSEQFVLPFEDHRVVVTIRRTNATGEIVFEDTYSSFAESERSRRLTLMERF